MVDEATKAALLENLDVQRFLGVLNGLLTGTKKLVIESIATPKLTQNNYNVDQPCVDYVHTFRVEDVSG